jgi:acyl-CoA thioesterase FadM
VYFPDDVVVAARATGIEDTRFTVEMALWSAREQAIAATGTALIVAYDYAKKCKAALPDDVRARLTSL